MGMERTNIRAAGLHSLVGSSYLTTMLAPPSRITPPAGATAPLHPLQSHTAVQVVARSGALRCPAHFLLGSGGSLAAMSRPNTTTSQVVAYATQEKNFMMDFMLGGVSAAVSKTSAAPIERIKLLIQNQDEMIKQGRLTEPYKGVGDCFRRTMADEGVVALWRGNLANVIRYFPTQVIPSSWDHSVVNSRPKFVGG